MKVIPRKDVIKILEYAEEDDLTLGNFENLLEKFGDDYFIEDGMFTKCTENQKRMDFLKTTEINEKFF